MFCSYFYAVLSQIHFCQNLWTFLGEKSFGLNLAYFFFPCSCLNRAHNTTKFIHNYFLGGKNISRRQKYKEIPIGKILILIAVSLDSKLITVGNLQCNQFTEVLVSSVWLPWGCQGWASVLSPFIVSIYPRIPFSCQNLACIFYNYIYFYHKQIYIKTSIIKLITLFNHMWY